MQFLIPQTHKSSNWLTYFLVISCLLFSSLVASAQKSTQTIRGNIIDQQSQMPLSYATLEVQGTSANAVSDSSGYFTINQVPIGRVQIAVSRTGYEPQFIPNVVVEAGKETWLNIELLEKIASSNVTIRGKSEKITDKQMATVSAYVFNAEDSRRFAGSRNDVARMAANFAGANTNNDGSNDIIIRGNSPAGLLWRLEGIDIPNPNHFGNLGATGGPVSMINNNVLGKSAFYTGAFPAAYGNAVAGAFDLQLRNGNNARRELTGQIGFTGLEAGIEGPFSSKSKASYLIYYRYSIPGLLKGLGLNVGTGSAVPLYQDVSFKVNLPTKKMGQFSLFGIGGANSIDFKGELKDTANFYIDPYKNLYNANRTGVVGIAHQYFFNSTTSSKITLAASGTGVTTRQDSLDDHRNPWPSYRQKSSEWRYALSASVNKKFSAQDRLTIGAMADDIHYSYNDSLLDGTYGFIPYINENNSTQLLRGYVQWQHRFSENITLNTGMYAQYLTLNSSFAAEPRMGLRYRLGKGSANIGYGRHSQMQPLAYYFVSTKIGDEFVQTNKNLDFTESHHIVAGWEQPLKNGWNYKIEAYTQIISKVPVESVSSNFSALNYGADYGFDTHDSLVSKGKGLNYGIEMTIDKPFSNGFYFLGTASFFDSKYKGSNGASHNTVFNGRYVINVLGGKEWKVREGHTIALDIKLTAAGGKRYTPLNESASKEAVKPIYYEEQSFDKQLKAYLRADIKFTYKMSGKKFMQEFFVDFQNATNNKNVYRMWYDTRNNIVRKQYQLGFFPNFNYRIQF
jgi:hypothetical protein